MTFTGCGVCSADPIEQCWCRHRCTDCGARPQGRASEPWCTDCFREVRHALAQALNRRSPKLSNVAALTKLLDEVTAYAEQPHAKVRAEVPTSASTQLSRFMDEYDKQSAARRMLFVLEPVALRIRDDFFRAVPPHIRAAVLMRVDVENPYAELLRVCFSQQNRRGFEHVFYWTESAAVLDLCTGYALQRVTDKTPVAEWSPRARLALSQSIA
jgi:hypothetical protein